MKLHLCSLVLYIFKFVLPLWACCKIQVLLQPLKVNAFNFSPFIRSLNNTPVNQSLLLDNLINPFHSFFLWAARKKNRLGNDGNVRSRPRVMNSYWGAPGWEHGQLGRHVLTFPKGLFWIKFFSTSWTSLNLYNCLSYLRVLPKPYKTKVRRLVFFLESASFSFNVNSVMKV